METSRCYACLRRVLTQLTVFRVNHCLIVYLLGMLLACLGISIVFTHLGRFCQSLAFTQSQYSQVLANTGLAGVIIRLTTGPIIHSINRWSAGVRESARQQPDSAEDGLVATETKLGRDGVVLPPAKSEQDIIAEAEGLLSMLSHFHSLQTHTSDLLAVSKGNMQKTENK
ncbi:unnamed protein product [Protopolystoma xenopodis]|uniref:Uncharacterized protein n=1 Tax=Protopolystoma xenopodis TaxID=117903 RepID=A0A448X2R3_9PLAT|nr:unnamed protein product [Protopolystoma xenopodis]